jgi:hypothetical protein
MRLARFNYHDNRGYVVLGPVFNKTLEVGGGKSFNSARTRLDVSVHFNTKGDHAGLKCHISWWRLMFELNLCDRRHWDWVKDRFYKDGEEPQFEGYPHE